MTAINDVTTTGAIMILWRYEHVGIGKVRPGMRTLLMPQQQLVFTDGEMGFFVL